jgi:hypothetical protein
LEQIPHAALIRCRDDNFIEPVICRRAMEREGVGHREGCETRNGDNDRTAHGHNPSERAKWSEGTDGAKAPLGAGHAAAHHLDCNRLDDDAASHKCAPSHLRSLAGGRLPLIAACAIEERAPPARTPIDRRMNREARLDAVAARVCAAANRSSRGADVETRRRLAINKVLTTSINVML